MSDDGDGFSHLQSVPEHKLIITMGRNSNSVCTVRCKCMVEYRNVSDRCLSYDWLAKTRTLEETMAVYKRHLATGEKRVRL